MENKLEFEGYVTSISSERIKTVGDKEFKYKQILLIEHKDRFAQKIGVDVEERLYGFFVLGEKVVVKINAYAWEYNGKMYNILRAWSCLRLGPDSDKYKEKVRRIKEYKKNTQKKKTPKKKVYEQIESEPKKEVEESNNDFNLDDFPF